MNLDRFEGAWKQFSGKVKEKWRTLTEDVPGVAAARREQRIGRAQERRGISEEAAERQPKEFLVRNHDWNLQSSGLRLIRITTQDRVDN